MRVQFTSEELVQIGHRIQEARLARKLPQKAVAEYCECTEKHISDIERGAVGASFPLIARIGKFLDVGVDYCLRDTAAYSTEQMISEGISQMLEGIGKETRMRFLKTLEGLLSYEKALGKKNGEGDR